MKRVDVGIDPYEMGEAAEKRNDTYAKVSQESKAAMKRVDVGIDPYGWVRDKNKE